MNTPSINGDETFQTDGPVKGVRIAGSLFESCTESPISMQKMDESRDGMEASTPSQENGEGGTRSLNGVENNDDNEGSDSHEVRVRREEEESIALARALMAEEAMAVSYHMSVDYLRNNRDQFSEEDLAALQAAMDDDDPSDGEIEEGEEGDLSYEMMLRLGEHLGDVKTERWKRIANEKITRLPTFAFCPQSALGKDENDCEVKCLICQFAYEKEECLRRLPCNHCFHKDCVDQWLQAKDFCPYCRTPIVDEEGMT